MSAPGWVHLSALGFVHLQLEVLSSLLPFRGTKKIKMPAVIYLEKECSSHDVVINLINCG